MTEDPTTAPPADESAPADLAAAIATVPAASAELTPPAPAEPAASAELTPPAPTDGGDVSLLALIDRLADLLGRSDLSELEVESGGTGLILRKPSALPSLSVVPSPAGAGATPPGASSGGAGADPTAAGASAAPTALPARPSVTAPLTGIFYSSPSPGAAPYVQVGGEVAIGQVIGLIEAMKLFNEIKSDLAGRVMRVAAESGALVKAKQPLIEVEPL
jgi:acetyl-CoA carboxylase biotin carboxyl carrier protein